jgi:hypothetical protein
MQLGEREVQAVVKSDLAALADIEMQLKDVQRRYDAKVTALKNHLADHACL